MTISIDTEAMARDAAKWRAYADELEGYADKVDRHHRSVLAAMLGPHSLSDLYDEFSGAKNAELEARRAAYHRMAVAARRHAASLDRTRTLLEQTDADSAQRIAAVLGAENSGATDWLAASNFPPAQQSDAAAKAHSAVSGLVAHSALGSLAAAAPHSPLGYIMAAVEPHTEQLPDPATAAPTELSDIIADNNGIARQLGFGN